jgi:hypothetical protein
MTTFTRREMFRLAMALPSIGVFTRFNPLVAADRNKVKITDIKAMQIKRIAGNCLIKIETDAGIVGYVQQCAGGAWRRHRDRRDCHNEFNEPSAVGIAKAVASMNNLVAGEEYWG